MGMYKAKQDVFRDKFYAKGSEVFIDEKKAKVNERLYEKISEAELKKTWDNVVENGNNGGVSVDVEKLKAELKTEMSEKLEAIKNEMNETIEALAKRVADMEEIFEAADNDAGGNDGKESEAAQPIAAKTAKANNKK